MLGSSASLLTSNSATRLNYLNPLQPDLATVTPSIARLNVNPSCAFQSSSIQHTWTSSIPRKKCIPHSTAQISDSPLSAADKKTWETCRQALTPFEFSIEEIDKMLGKAFGHLQSPYWGEERKQEVPKLETVNEILDYLRNLGLSDDDLRKLLKKFPEVLGCSLEHELKANVKILENDWGIKGKTLRNLLLRNPKVLGYNVDCKGDCMAQCTRCWVRF